MNSPSSEPFRKAPMASHDIGPGQVSARCLGTAPGGTTASGEWSVT